MSYLIYALVLVLAGIVQGTTGFGAGVVSMLILPYLLPLPEAAGVAGAVALTVCLLLTYRYRTSINWRLLPLVTLSFITASVTAISLASHLNTVLLKLAFGLFLVLLSLYFLLGNGALTIKATPGSKIAVGVISGLCDGFFGIGGPLMVVLFLGMTKSREEYLGTLQLSFSLISLVNLTLRISQGILQLTHLPYIGLGMIMIALGLQLAHRINDRVNPDHLRQATYVLIGLSGLITLVTTL